MTVGGGPRGNVQFDSGAILTTDDFLKKVAAEISSALGDGAKKVGDRDLNGDVKPAAAFHELHAAGKVRSFGVSNFAESQVELFASRLELPLVANQMEISVVCMDSLHDGRLDQCQRLGITPMGWSPLGGGRLFSEASDQAERLRDVLGEIGSELDGATSDQVALAWLLRHPSGIVPGVGTGKKHRIESAARAVEVSLSREQWFRIWCASAGHGVP